MNGYVVIDGVTYDLVRREAVEENTADESKVRKLGEVAVGDIVKIGKHEMIVLSQQEGKTELICKDLFGKTSVFGSSNNYDGSKVDKLCEDFAEQIGDAIGPANMLLFDVDLTSDDGLKDYGVIRRKAALLTADQYRKYVQILDRYKQDDWWWIATPHSTETHENADWVKCVSPAGFVNNRYYGSQFGVRPFCILKSSIFVSK